MIKPFNKIALGFTCMILDVKINMSISNPAGMLTSKLIPISDVPLEEWKKIEKESSCFLGSVQQIDFVNLFDSTGVRNYKVFTVYEYENLIGGMIFQALPYHFGTRLVSVDGPVAVGLNVNKIMDQLNNFIIKNKRKFSFSLSFLQQTCLTIPAGLLKYSLKYPNETTVIVLKDRTYYDN